MGNSQGQKKVPGRTPSTASVRVESGTWYTMGNYTVNLMDRLGQGSFGVVYRGKEKSTGKVVAVKQIKISKDEQGSVALGEIKNLEKLPHHPNLVQYRGYHFHQDAFWLFMEFCDMGDISEYYKKNFPQKIPMAHQIHFMYQISSSITHLHSLASPIIHRDIKPANVLLCSNNHGYPIIKLTDFGTSKVSQDVANPVNTYMMSTAVGTPMYMAPEFYASENPSYDKSVDVFAMGMVFLTMVQAEPQKALLSPKTGCSSGRIQMPIGMRMFMGQERGDPPLQLTEVLPGDPECIKQVKKLVIRMCDRDPKRRPKAATVTDALSQSLNSVKSALSTQVLEGTVTQWPLRTVTDVRLSDLDESDEEAGATGGSARKSSSSSSDSETASGAVAYMLIQEALKAQMSQKVKQREEKEQLEGMPLMELLRLAGAESQQEKQVTFEPGELVKVDDDAKRVKELQEGYGGWVSGMEKYLGQTGKITRKILHVYKVKFGDGVELSYNPAVLRKLEGSDQLVAGLVHAIQSAIHDAGDPVADKFPRYAVVDIEDDADKLKALQTEEHGGFSNKMILACGIRGIVNKVSDGSVYVECVNGDNWWFNPESLTVVNTEGEEIEEGDFVVISNIEDLVKQKQVDHGGWNPEMEKALGSAGIVKQVVKGRHVARVEVTGGTWSFNMDLLRFVTKGEDLFAAIMKKKLISMLVD